MRKIKLYIAISLDGFIADKAGGVGWLDEIPHPEGEDYGYQSFIEGCDTTIMGAKTYRQVLAFPGGFPYANLKNYVITRRPQDPDAHATFISGDRPTLEDLKDKQGKDIFLIGGGEINTLFHNAELIDEYIVFIMPVVLGEGIALFGERTQSKSLKLIDSKTYDSGVVRLHYTK